MQQHQDILAANSRLLKEIDDLSEEGKVLAREEEELRNRQTELFRDEASAKTRTEGLRRMPYWQDVQDEEVVPVGDRTYEALAETRRRLQSRMEGLDDSRARLKSRSCRQRKIRDACRRNCVICAPARRPNWMRQWFIQRGSSARRAAAPGTACIEACL